MSETFRQACEEFRGGYFTNMENGSIYPVSQVIAFLDSGGTEEQIIAGALDKKKAAPDTSGAAK